jgi:hypothetical protein
MNPLGFRFCLVSDEAEALAATFDKLGFTRRPLEGIDQNETFAGAIFEAGSSWIEIWPCAPGMPAGQMLQCVVADADAVAANAREAGLRPGGPTDAHGERIYFVSAPGGLQLSFQSALNETERR